MFNMTEHVGISSDQVNSITRGSIIATWRHAEGKWMSSSFMEIKNFDPPKMAW